MTRKPLTADAIAHHPLRRPDAMLVWGACCDCGAPLWVTVGEDARDAHCTPCHGRRIARKEV